MEDKEQLKAIKSKVAKGKVKRKESLSDKHARMANEINSKNKANPKRYKQYLEDAHSAATNGGYHYGHD